MKYLAALLIGFIVYFSSGTALAATAQDENTASKVQAPKIREVIKEKDQRAESMEADPSNRASMLYILLAAGVMIVVVNIIVPFAKKKMEEDIKVVQDKTGAEAQKDKS